MFGFLPAVLHLIQSLALYAVSVNTKIASFLEWASFVEPIGYFAVYSLSVLLTRDFHYKDLQRD